MLHSIRCVLTRQTLWHLAHVSISFQWKVMPRKQHILTLWRHNLTGSWLEMPLSGKWQTKTKPIPMKWQPQKPNTKPIFILPTNTNIKPTFNKVVLKIPINTKKIPRNLTHKYQIPIWFGYFLGIPNSWLPIDITSRDTSSATICKK